MRGRRRTVGIVVVAAVCALGSGCTVRTESRAASADSPIAAADDLGAGSATVAPPVGDRTSEVTSTGASTTTTPTSTGPSRGSSSTTSSTTEPPLTGWAATDAYLLRRIIGGGSTAASFAISVDGEIVHTSAMGVRTLGELMRLPRAGFAKRFGVERLADLDRLLGRRADPRRRLVRRERYRGRLDLDHEIEDHERILEALRPLLAELEQFLRTRQRGITALQCRFHHYRAAPTSCTLRLAHPEANAGRLQSLLRERLANLVLPEPVRRCELRGGALSERPLASSPLWPAGERGHAPAGEMPALIEHLRARLGAGAVYGLTGVSEHRPENAWRVAEPALAPVVSKVSTGDSSVGAPFHRPLWLLHVPQELASQRGRPRHGGELRLLAGPERIESGWWDGADVQRDYYVASNTHGARLWIYREYNASRRWFLHGIFG